LCLLLNERMPASNITPAIVTGIASYAGDLHRIDLYRKAL
jgi:hypothetical protein